MAGPTPGRDLAPYAARAEASAGRHHVEVEHAYRDCYERDRDRIIHSRAFRRLEYKTQVFPNYRGDHFRTRLTHTIEVAQLARTVARTLGLNVALAEAIALAHDLGHPPFGHVGEETLDGLMRDHGGFEHNRQALRIVDDLEEKYAGFPGLNLTYEVREGIVKHTTRYDRFRSEELRGYHPEDQPLLEAQIIDWVDSVAYNIHDLDDGIEARILTVGRLRERLPVFARLYEEKSAAFPSARERKVFNETIRGLIDFLITDIIEQTLSRLTESEIGSIEDVRRYPGRLVAHSSEAEEQLNSIADLLFGDLYRSESVAVQMDEAREALVALFHAYRDEPGLMPRRHRERSEIVGLETAIADYVAGMTDRFALKECARVVEA